MRTLALVTALTVLAGSASAGTTRYDPLRSGHPLRVIAYMLHPVGVVADTLIFHPAWWLGTHEPLRTLFGVDVVVDDSAELAREIQLQKAEAGVPAGPPPPPPPLEPDTEPAPAPSDP
jgi:hypothetical protein